MGSGLGLLGGIAAGAAIMYLFDPRQGASRRSRISSTAANASHQAAEKLAGTWNEVAAAAGHLGHNLADHAAHAATHATEIAGNARSSLHDSLHNSLHGAQSAASDLREKISRQARKTLARLGHRAADYAKDLREHAGSYFERESPAPIAGYAMTAVGAVAVGVGVMYLLDPYTGRHRREVIIGRASEAVAHTGRAFNTTGLFLRRQFDRMVHGTPHRAEPAEAFRTETFPAIPNPHGPLEESSTASGAGFATDHGESGGLPAM
jgi:gas vesicle protein